jgi:biofilm PGA synthesis N-glycosyltransferase PgaC
MILDFAVLSVTIIYVVFILWCNYHWSKTNDTTTRVLKKHDTKVAVIIPTRNESANLPFLLESLSNQTYPSENFQVIISDDHSDDNTIEVAENCISELNLKNAVCIKSHETSKKNALNAAIEAANAELIISTDADVIVGRAWISSIVNEYKESGAWLICGPVKLSGNRNYFERLQALEFSGLIGIGAAGIASDNPMFCNGANLAFPKKIFREVKGYEKSLSVSGDDTQLMMKIHKLNPGKISFLKDSRAIVKTRALGSKSELLGQRKRWASKIIHTLSPFTVFIAMVGWLIHALLVIQFIVSVLHATFLILCLSLTAKIISELIFLKYVNKFFSEKTPSWIVVSAQPIYCLYIVALGLLSPFSSFRWKGRMAR